jgi:hypothetical protein
MCTQASFPLRMPSHQTASHKLMESKFLEPQRSGEMQGGPAREERTNDRLQGRPFPSIERPGKLPGHDGGANARGSTCPSCRYAASATS